MDINAEDKMGRVPLYFALEKQHDSVIETLLERGAKVTSPRLLHLACNLQNENLALNVLRVFILTVLDNYKNKVDREKLREECERTIFQAINSKDDFGRTTLYHACAAGHQRLVEELLTLGAQPNTLCVLDIPSKEEGTALHRAIMNGHAACAKLLLTRGAAVAVPTSVSGNAPLHLACEQQNEQLIGLLLQHGAPHDKPLNKYGKTPFQCVRVKNVRKLMLREVIYRCLLFPPQSKLIV